MFEKELTPEQKFAAEDAETIAQRGLKRGRAKEDIVSELCRLDWPQNAARQLVERVADDLRRLHASPEERRDLQVEARRQFFAGLIIAMLAICFAVFAFFAALVRIIPFILVILVLCLFFGGTILAGRGWKRWRLSQDKAPSELRPPERSCDGDEPKPF
jgi:uncharacterized membrane protein